MKKLWLFVLSISLFPFLSSAYALTEVSWDRNIDTDLVDHYEVYVCNTTPTCSPLAGGIRLGVNVPQPPATVPVDLTIVQRVTMPFPVTSPVVGRASAVAVDVVGNKSLESNVVVFRSQALNAPKGLLVK